MIWHRSQLYTHRYNVFVCRTAESDQSNTARSGLGKMLVNWKPPSSPLSLQWPCLLRFIWAEWDCDWNGLKKITLGETKVPVCQSESRKTGPEGLLSLREHRVKVNHTETHIYLSWNGENAAWTPFTFIKVNAPKGSFCSNVVVESFFGSLK